MRRESFSQPLWGNVSAGLSGRDATGLSPEGWKAGRTHPPVCRKEDSQRGHIDRASGRTAVIIIMSTQKSMVTQIVSRACLLLIP